MDPLSIHCNRLSHLQDRLVALDFRRAELYNFKPEHLPAVKAFISERGITPSIHCPLRQAPWYPYPVTWSFLSTDVHREEREMSFELIAGSLQDAVDFGAAYVVVHYPTPASPEAGQLSAREQHAIAWDSAQRLQQLSVSYEVPICIEGFGPSPFMESGFIVAVLEACPSLRYCFDTGHMALMAQRDGLDYFGFLEEVAAYVGCVHIWNTRGMEDYRAYHHLPPHPALRPADGWVDMERVVRTVRTASPEAVFVLEHSGEMPPEFGLDYREGIAWFKSLVLDSTSTTVCMSQANIVLCGFMGTGKTSVGRALAARLGRPFVDMDDVLAERFGMSIPEVFVVHGEAAFRQAETALCHELAAQTGLVISTGGGALVTAANREAFARTGVLICLHCELDELWRRIGQGENRPMLQGDDLRPRIEELLRTRRPAYAAIAQQIDTTHLTVDQITAEALAIWKAAQPCSPGSSREDSEEGE